MLLTVIPHCYYIIVLMIKYFSYKYRNQKCTFKHSVIAAMLSSHPNHLQYSQCTLSYCSGCTNSVTSQSHITLFYPSKEVFFNRCTHMDTSSVSHAVQHVIGSHLVHVDLVFCHKTCAHDEITLIATQLCGVSSISCHIHCSI